LTHFILFHFSFEKGSLVDVLTTPSSYPDIDSLEALYDSKLEISVRHPGLITDIFGDELPGTKLGNLRTRLRKTDDDLLNVRISGKGDVAGLERYSGFQYNKIGLRLRTDGVSFIHLVKECPRYFESTPLISL
jgi:hypothetical protein